MTSITPRCDRISLSAEARRIAGRIWDDATDPGAKISFRARQAAAWINVGTDGDLTGDDRDGLLALARRAELAGL